MRIISGENKGRKLFSPKDHMIRPTEDRVREALFNIISDRVYGSLALDLFGGSGAVTCELISRGASKVYINEIEKNHIDLIKQNINFLSKKDRIKVLNNDFKIAIKKLAQDLIKFDLVFLDPPYDMGFEIEALKLIEDLGLLKKTGILIVESSHEIDYNGEVLLKTNSRKYGRAYLTFFEMGDY